MVVTRQHPVWGGESRWCDSHVLLYHDRSFYYGVYNQPDIQVVHPHLLGPRDHLWKAYASWWLDKSQAYQQRFGNDAWRWQASCGGGTVLGLHNVFFYMCIDIPWWSKDHSINSRLWKFYSSTFILVGIYFINNSRGVFFLMVFDFQGILYFP